MKRPDVLYYTARNCQQFGFLFRNQDKIPMIMEEQYSRLLCTGFGYRVRT